MRIGTLAAVVFLATAAAPARAADWVAAWGASPTGSADGGPARSTVRNLVRVSLGGTRVRIRVANALSGSTPLVIGAASVALMTVGPLRLQRWPRCREGHLGPLSGRRRISYMSRDT